MTYFLGIDGGNSKTLAIVADGSGRAVGIGRAGCGSHQVSGSKLAMQQIQLAAGAALKQAGIEQADLAVAYYSLAGADLEVDYDILKEAIGQSPLAPRWAVDNDVIAALRSGTDKRDAVVVVVGSGTNAAGRNAQGQEIRMAGIGWMSGDWGGGGDMAREAIRLSIRAWDGRGSQTRLQPMILEALALPDVETLILKLHTREISRAQQFDLVPLIFAAADARDPVASELVLKAGMEVASTATALLRRLQLLESRADVVLAGGVFKSDNELLLGIISDRISGVAQNVRIVLPDVEPAAGAVLCAMDLDGVGVDDELRCRLVESSTALLDNQSGQR